MNCNISRSCRNLSLELQKANMINLSSFLESISHFLHICHTNMVLLYITQPQRTASASLPLSLPAVTVCKSVQDINQYVFPQNTTLPTVNGNRTRKPESSTDVAPRGPAWQCKPESSTEVAVRDPTWPYVAPSAKNAK